MGRIATSGTRKLASREGVRRARSPRLPPIRQAASSSFETAAARIPVELSIAPERVLYWLLAVIAMLLLAATLGMMAFLGFGRDTVWGLRKLFDVSQENNIPTYFSALQLLAAAVLLGVIARHQALIRAPWLWHFLALAVGFLVLSIDEMASMHETLLGPLGRFLLGDITYFTWLGPASVIIALVMLSYLRFLLALPPRFQLLFVVSGTVFIAGAVGAEWVGSEIARDRLGDDASWAYQIEVIVEEGFEMAGISLFIYALLAYMAENCIASWRG
jgi:hypothetical protein